MKKRLAIISSLIALTILALLGATMLIAYTDRAFICENTGSRYGYREWFFGVHTRKWLETSELDRFMQARHGKQLSYRWTSYQGDGHSLLGIAKSRGHGRPGPITMLRPGMLDSHVIRLTDPEKLALYRLFSSSDENAIRDEMDKICDKCFEH